MAAFRALLTVVLTFRWFNSSLSGLLILTILLYLYVDRFSQIDPLNGPELLAWTVSIPESIKIAVGSSLLTIIGFLIAFQSATKNWRDQMAATVALEASRDIHRFFTEASRNVTTIQIFAEQLVEFRTRALNAQNVNDVAFEIDFVNDTLSDFLQARARLKQMNIEVHDLLPRYSAVLASSRRSIADLVSATAAFTGIIQHMWFTVPVVRSTHPTALVSFVQAIDEGACNGYVKEAKKRYTAMTTLSGLVEGKLTSHLLRVNLSYFRHVWAVIAAFPHIQDMRRKYKQGSPFTEVTAALQETEQTPQ